MKLSRLFVAGSLALAATVGSAALAHAEDRTSTISILHGVPGATVDVYANGAELLTNFAPGTLTAAPRVARRLARPGPALAATSGCRRSRTA